MSPAQFVDQPAQRCEFFVRRNRRDSDLSRQEGHHALAERAELQETVERVRVALALIGHVEQQVRFRQPPIGAKFRG